MKVTQSCPTLCNPMDYTVHGILQARILGWVAFPFSSGSSHPRDWTQVSHIAEGFFTSWATWILVWVAYPFSRGSSWSRNWTGVSCIVGGFFTNWAIREALINLTKSYKEVRDKLVLKLRVVQDTLMTLFLIVFPNIIVRLGTRTIFESTLFLLHLTVVECTQWVKKEQIWKALFWPLVQATGSVVE